MKATDSKLPTPLSHVEALHAYTPGDQPTGGGWTKLNTNESPFAPSPAVLEAIVQELKNGGDKLRLYPQPQSLGLRETLAAHYSLQAEQVIIGNGSDDILNLLIRVFCDKDHPALTLDPSYSLYPVLIDIQNGSCQSIALDRDCKLPIEEIINSSTEIFFLTSPNAPTGVGFSNQDIRKILEGFSGLVVVDEAYADFAEESAQSLLHEYSNLFITRTFSKSYSLAGLRVGYGMGSSQVVNWLDRVRDSYNLDRLAHVGAIAAFKDQAYLHQRVETIKATRQKAALYFEQLGWFAYPSQTNFLFFEPKKNDQTGSEIANSLYEFLKEQKILIRYFGKPAPVEGFLRVTIGNDRQMEHFFTQVSAWQQDV